MKIAKKISLLLLVFGLMILAMAIIMVMVLNDISSPGKAFLLRICGVSCVCTMLIIFPIEKVKKMPKGLKKYMLLLAIGFAMMCMAIFGIYVVLLLYALT